MTTIEWTNAPGFKGETWNPSVGCSRVSAGCEHCYAEGVAHRKMQPAHEGLTVLGKKGPRWNGTVRWLPERLVKPVGWRKPRMVFVNSMSDLFHEGLTFDQIDRVFGTMWACRFLGREARPGHVFQVLTKRPARMLEYLSGERLPERWSRAAVYVGGGIDPDRLSDSVYYDAQREGLSAHPRIWLGVSVEDQGTADERTPLLIQCPAAIRFVSYEPALGPIDFRCLHHKGVTHIDALGGRHGLTFPLGGECAALDWVIAGAESGPRARPAEWDWFRSARDQCVDAGVPFFFKQWAVNGKKHPLPELDGRQWMEWPNV